MLRNAKHPSLTILGYVSDQSRGQFCLSNIQSTDSLFDPFTYLCSQKGPILIDNQNLSRERGLLSSHEIKESKAPGFREPVVALVSKECLVYFVVIKYSQFSFFFIPDYIT